MSRQLDKLDYHVEVTNEALALFVRFWLTANPPLPDAVLAAAKAKGNERYEGFVEVLARKLEAGPRSEEHTSELQSLMRISYAVFCLKKKKRKARLHTQHEHTIHRRQQV